MPTRRSRIYVARIGLRTVPSLFLDPYGMQVEWATIESIAHTQAIDLWLLFSAGHWCQPTLEKVWGLSLDAGVRG